MSMKKTRQGVRDLSSLPSKPRGRVLEMPPQSEGESRTIKQCSHHVNRFQSDCEECVEVEYLSRNF
jgi:hypothetical protein